MGRRRTPRMPALNVTHHTLAKIKRIGLRHRKSPPTGSESHSHPRWNPNRFNLTVRCASAPYYYSPSANVVYVNQAGAVLSGINFGNATVIIDANNVTIK